MARMRTRRFTFLTVASLVFCAMVCLMWARSYFAALRFPEALRHSGYRICSSDGRVFVQRLVIGLAPGEKCLIFMPVPRVQGDFRDLDGSRERSRLLRQAEADPTYSCIFTPSIHYARASLVNGFGFNWTLVLVGKTDVTTATVPYWALVVGTIIAPFFQFCLGRRKGVGKCAKCGYDLRATPRRCPECGMPANSPPHSLTIPNRPTILSPLAAVGGGECKFDFVQNCTKSGLGGYFACG